MSLPHNWLSVTSASGAAPPLLTAQISLANLPGGGLVAGVFTGQILIQTTVSRVTVPVSVTVGDSVFTQQNRLSFSKPFGGADPLPQTVQVSSTGAPITFTASATSATGGNWLSASPSGFCCTTPRSVTVSVNPVITLAAGTYTGQVKFPLQLYSTLAYGGRGIQYFTYFAPQIGNYRLAAVDQFGSRTPTWDMLRRVNNEIHALAPTLIRLRSIGVFHYPDVPE